MSPLPQLEGIAPDAATVGPGGHLLVGGCDVVDVALRYGTPIYLYDEATIRARARAFREAVGAYPAGATVQYAAKAYCARAARAVCETVIQVHGGIGFTWEHDAHLYWRRAKVDRLLLGDAAEHLDAVARLSAGLVRR